MISLIPMLLSGKSKFSSSFMSPPAVPTMVKSPSTATGTSDDPNPGGSMSAKSVAPPLKLTCPSIRTVRFTLTPGASQANRLVKTPSVNTNSLSLQLTPVTPWSATSKSSLTTWVPLTHTASPVIASASAVPDGHTEPLPPGPPPFAAAFSSLGALTVGSPPVRSTRPIPLPSVSFVLIQTITASLAVLPEAPTVKLPATIPRSSGFSPPATADWSIVTTSSIDSAPSSAVPMMVRFPGLPPFCTSTPKALSAEAATVTAPSIFKIKSQPLDLMAPNGEPVEARVSVFVSPSQETPATP